MDLKLVNIEELGNQIDELRINEEMLRQANAFLSILWATDRPFYEKLKRKMVKRNEAIINHP